MSNSFRRRGFTLIELLVVISIIALLISILLPSLGAARRTASITQDATQMRGVMQSVFIYASDNNSQTPTTSGLSNFGTPALVSAALYGKASIAGPGLWGADAQQHRTPVRAGLPAVRPGRPVADRRRPDPEHHLGWLHRVRTDVEPAGQGPPAHRQ